MIILQRYGICCQKLSAERVKQPAVSSENPSRCPVEGKILPTDWPRESRLATLPCPRAKLSKVAFPKVPSLAGARAPLRGPHYLCAQSEQGPGPPTPTSARSRKCCPGRTGAAGKGREERAEKAGRDRDAMETTGSRPSPKLRAFLQTSHSGIHDVASSAASQLRGSFGRQHKSLIVREKSLGEGAKRATAKRRGWGPASVQVGPAGAPGGCLQGVPQPPPSLARGSFS
ncbi:uncharacterized protein LOC116535163 [Sapajus apella]|uniref:Uncharacterized protein LOC116535163 n=1 Tax=Sapajus apella TaxID=9515 RepID=A0A6J3G1A4_SAPAP|nr:uncharacterized protein LOC116535163 [Sapajus apella]